MTETTSPGLYGWAPDDELTGANSEVRDEDPTLPEGWLVAAGEAEADAAPAGVAIMLGLGMTSEAELTVAGVPVDPPGLHCTVGYLADPAASYSDTVKASLIDALAPLSDMLPLQADAFGTAVLNDDDGDWEAAAVVLVQSDSLAALHDAVSDAIASMASDTFPMWLAHVTVAYTNDPTVIPETVVGSQIEFNRLVLGWGPDQIVVAGDGAVDPSVDTAPDALTAAGEDPAVTAPAAPAAPPPPPGSDVPAPNDAPEATGGDSPASTAPDLTPQGTQWEGPLALLDTPSGDGRIIAATGGTVRPLPLPLSWQKESGYEHEDSVVVGRILAAEVRGNILWGTGDFLDPMMNFDVEQAMAQIDAGLGLISVDLAITEMGFADETGTLVDPQLMQPEQEVYQVALVYQLGGATVVSFPAFADARITLVPSVEPEAPEVIAMPVDGTFAAATPEPSKISDDGTSVVLTDGTSVKVGDSVGYPAEDGTTTVGALTSIDQPGNSVMVTPPPDDDGTQPADMTVAVADLVPAGPGNAVDDAAAGAMESLLASSEVRPYTKAFFDKRDLSGPTALTVNRETGEVYGHLADRESCHIGKLAQEGKCVAPPYSKTDYSDFHLGQVETDKGLLPIGKITVGTGHALPGGGFANAVRHYDDSGTAVAVVRAYDDAYGIQVTGQLIHDVPAGKVDEMLRSPLSGDWRMETFDDGTTNMELCAALAVNVPGFQVKPRLGFTPGGRQLSLVASGVINPQPGRVIDAIGLPSGATINRADFEALVASAMDAMQRSGRAPAETSAQRFALRKARARLSLGV